MCLKVIAASNGIHAFYFKSFPPFSRTQFKLSSSAVSIKGVEFSYPILPERNVYPEKSRQSPKSEA